MRSIVTLLLVELRFEYLAVNEPELTPTAANYLRGNDKYVSFLGNMVCYFLL